MLLKGLAHKGTPSKHVSFWHFWPKVIFRPTLSKTFYKKKGFTGKTYFLNTKTHRPSRSVFWHFWPKVVFRPTLSKSFYKKNVFNGKIYFLKKMTLWTFENPIQNWIFPLHGGWFWIPFDKQFQCFYYLPLPLLHKKRPWKLWHKN